jgi:hypothetical protein
VNLRTRIEKIEAKHVEAERLSLSAQILAARGTFAPTHTREQLVALCAGTDLAARMARGWLRIGFYTAQPAGGAAPVLDPQAALPATMGYLYDKPLEFVLFAFEWGSEPAMCVVELPDGYRVAHGFEATHGPDTWACELLEQIGAEVRARAFNGRDAVEPIRMATASGHGIGKSSVTAWLILWIMSTRPNARGTVTANTSAQLGSKTWAELGKWLRRSLAADWFEYTTGKASMRLSHREAPEAWRCDAQTSREENSESFAGQHAADSTSFYILDEASAIPERIWEVAEGGLSDGEPMMFAFGNPTRNYGAFHAAFNGQRHRWIRRQIDSRSVSITNKELIAQWLEDFGVTSDFVKVRVLGQFPSASSLQFIGRELVDDAAAREVEDQRHEVVVVGVDPARFGDDASVIWTRIGRDARTVAPIRLRGVDTQELASRVAEHVNLIASTGRLVILNVDGGGVGGGVVDRLRALGFDVNEVQFGAKAMDAKKYVNRRAEMWGLMRDWLARGALPRDEELAIDLTNVEYSFNKNDQIQLERKESMKARGLASPDNADALALTFAVPVPVLDLMVTRGGSGRRAAYDHDPIALAEAEMRAGR